MLFFLERNIKLFKQSKIGSKPKTWEIMRECEFTVYSNLSGICLLEFYQKNKPSKYNIDSDMFAGFISALIQLALNELKLEFQKIIFDAPNSKLVIMIGKYFSCFFNWKSVGYSFEKVLKIAQNFLEYLENDASQINELHHTPSTILDLYDFI